VLLFEQTKIKRSSVYHTFCDSLRLKNAHEQQPAVSGDLQYVTATADVIEVVLRIAQVGPLCEAVDGLTAMADCELQFDKTSLSVN
jgi:hypothetical protein